MDVLDHQPLISPNISTVRQRSPLKDLPSVTMIKVDRGLVQRSLLYCFEKGYFSLIRYILQSGTGDARECDNEGRTGLMYCCFIDDDLWAQNVALTLLEYGAKVEDPDQRGLNALHYAIITQRKFLIRRYLSALELDLDRTVDIHGNTFLHYACSTGNPDIVRLILNVMKRFSSNLNTKNHYGSTAYDISCQLKHERCQNLIRNEISLRERQQTATIRPNAPHISFNSLDDRRSSTAIRARLTTPSAYRNGSLASVPVLTPNRSRYPSISTLTNEKVALPPPVFVDPIESRTISLKRNESLDLSLTNQAKKRADYAPLPFLSQSAVFTSSSSTWRDDFSKVVNQLQSYKTSSYKKTVHPPLSNQLPSDLFDKLYGNGSIEKRDSGDRPPVTPLPGSTSQKVIHQRRGSTASTKSLLKGKK